jgi:hypothetical protein
MYLSSIMAEREGRCERPQSVKMRSVRSRYFYFLQSWQRFTKPVDGTCTAIQRPAAPHSMPLPVCKCCSLYKSIIRRHGTFPDRCAA